ncbi:MAG: 5-formyltetrahydrofolate cyclo-ligase [Lachnospiraceae bacterium]|nr:5-formyltetrahydrofolate cyclo-ligase [Lachnospiraceae bacterium]
MKQDKRQIRLSFGQKRNALSETEVRLRSEKICDMLQQQYWFQKAEKICFYYPLGKEVNLLPLAAAALALGKQTAFPRVNGADMEFYQVHDLSEFAPGTFGVMEPVGREKVSAENGLVLVPGLVFDREGGRMGYGKGYYDRYFSRVPACCKLGVCFEMQLISQTPCDRHDIFMDGVVTEQRIIRH